MQAALYREAAAKVGRKPRVVLMRDGWVAPSQDEAERGFGPLWVQDMLFYFRWCLLTPNPQFYNEADFTVARLTKFLVLGDPQTCVYQMGFCSEVVDADYVVLRCRVPLGPSRLQNLDRIQLFGEEVLPKLK